MRKKMPSKFTPVSVVKKRPDWMTPGINPNEEVNFTPISIVQKTNKTTKSPAAYIDGNVFYIAAKKYNLNTDDINTMNKIVNLVNEGLGVDEAAKQVASVGMTETSASQGGLNATNRPNPYGLRAYEENGSYGGEMMPKDVGFLGELQGNGENKGQVMTEYSLSDEKGSYPSLVPTLTPEEIQQVLFGKITKAIDQKARAHRDMRVKQGLSPFYNTIND